MKNKNLLRMTSLLGVLVMAGCSVPNAPVLNNENINNTLEGNEVVKIMPENYTGGQLSPAR